MAVHDVEARHFLNRAIHFLAVPEMSPWVFSEAPEEIALTANVLI